MHVGHLEVDGGRAGEVNEPSVGVSLQDAAELFDRCSIEVIPREDIAEIRR